MLLIDLARDVDEIAAPVGELLLVDAGIVRDIPARAPRKARVIKDALVEHINIILRVAHHINKPKPIRQPFQREQRIENKRILPVVIQPAPGKRRVVFGCI